MIHLDSTYRLSNQSPRSLNTSQRPFTITAIPLNPFFNHFDLLLLSFLYSLISLVPISC